MTRRLLPSGLPAHDRARRSTPRATSPAGSTASSASRSLAGTPFERDDGQGRHRRHERRRRGEPALRDPQSRGRPAHAADRRAGAVVALGRLDAHRVSRPRCSSTSSRSPRARIRWRFARALLGEAAAPSRRCSSSPRKRPAGASRSRPARPAKSAAAASPCTNRSTPSSRRSPRSRSTRTTSSRVDRVVCAVDCGLAVNPDVVRAQMEGGIGFGAGRRAVRRDHAQGRRASSRSNFHDYPVLRINEMPAVEVHIVPSTRKAHRRRRARRAAARARGGQRDRGRDRQAPAQAAVQARLTAIAPRRGGRRSAPRSGGAGTRPHRFSAGSSAVLSSRSARRLGRDPRAVAAIRSLAGCSRRDTAVAASRTPRLRSAVASPRARTRADTGHHRGPASSSASRRR